MDFQILDYQDGGRDAEITSLLSRVFVGEGYTDRSAEGMFAISELQKRGEILVALSSGRLAGMVIFVHPSSPARQVAGPGEAEIHLLAVEPKVRGHGIASSLIAACCSHAALSGYSGIVLSTQPAMRAARHLYQKMGYRQNPARGWSRGVRTYRVYEKILK